VLEFAHLAIGDCSEFIEYGAVAAGAERHLGGGLRSHVLVEQPIGQLGQGVGLLTSPLDAPVGMQRVLDDQPRVLAIGVNATSDAAFDGSIELERFEPRCRMTGDRCCQEHGAVAKPVLGIDRDDVRLEDVGVAMGKMGAGVIDIVQQPTERGWAVELNKTTPKGRLPYTNCKAIAKGVGTIGFVRDERWEGLPEPEA
jgi:hypothetical protein